MRELIDRLGGGLKSLASPLKYEGRDRRFFVYISIFALVAVISLLIFLFDPNPLIRQILYFPADKTGIAEAELRYVKIYNDRDEAIKNFVTNIVLGPESVTLLPYFSNMTRVNSVITRNGVLFVDLSAEALIPTNNNVDIRANIDIFKKTIVTAFTELKEIRVSINGFPELPIQAPKEISSSKLGE